MNDFQHYNSNNKILFRAQIFLQNGHFIFDMLLSFLTINNRSFINKNLLTAIKSSKFVKRLFNF